MNREEALTLLKSAQSTEDLKSLASQLGVPFSGNIGADTLQARIANHIETFKDALQKIEPMNQMSESALEEKDQIVSTKKITQVSQQNPDNPLSARMSRKQAITKKRKESSELCRIRLVCMNPEKKEWDGEFISVGSSALGTFKKYIPYHAPKGWYVPKIIFNYLKNKKCNIRKTIKDELKRDIVVTETINEYAIESLPKHTKEEMQQLAAEQALIQNV